MTNIIATKHDASLILNQYDIECMGKKQNCLIQTKLSNSKKILIQWNWLLYNGDDCPFDINKLSQSEAPQ